MRVSFRQAAGLGRAGEDFRRAAAVREGGSFSVRTKWAVGKAPLGRGGGGGRGGRRGWRGGAGGEGEFFFLGAEVIYIR